MTDHAFDVVVLGGGSGGYAAAHPRGGARASPWRSSRRTRSAGPAFIAGCIPTKALLHAAEVADTAREADAIGVRASFEGIDAAGVRAYREGIVAKKFKGLEGLVKARGITVVAGEGRLEADRAVRVGEDRYVGADVILATGSYSRTLPGPRDRRPHPHRAKRLWTWPRCRVV